MSVSDHIDADRLLAERCVRIRFATPGIVGASVRDGLGVHDVRWSSSIGWTCSCGDGNCSHQIAVASVAARPES